MPFDNHPFVLPEARPLIDAQPVDRTAPPVDDGVLEEQRILKHLIAKMRTGQSLNSLEVQWYAYICGCGAMPVRRLAL